MATASPGGGNHSLRQFDIHVPFEFLEKCTQQRSALSCVGLGGICWSADVRDMMTNNTTNNDGQQHLLQHQDHKNSKIIENMGFEQRRFDIPSENVQTCHIQTCVGPDNMLLISFSRLQLQVLEGRCAFWLSNMQKDEPSCTMYPAMISNKYSSEAGSTVLDGFTTSKLNSPSTLTSLVDVETENNINISGDLIESSKNLDCQSADSNIISGCYSTSLISTSGDGFSEENTAEYVVEKQPCLTGTNSDLVTSKNSFSLYNSITSPLKKNLDENVFDDKQVNKLSFQLENNTACRLQEPVSSIAVSCPGTASNDLLRVNVSDNDVLPDSPTINLTKESEIKAMKKTSTRKPKKQCNQQVDVMIKVNDDSNIPKKNYMLRGVRVPKCLIEQEKNDRQHVPKNNCKNQKIESTKGCCQDIENSLSDKEFHSNNDKHASLSTSENPVSPSLLQSMSKKHPADLSEPKSRPKRRKRNNTRVVQCRYCKKMFCDYTGVDEHVKKFHVNEVDLVEYIAELKKLKVVNCDKCNVTLQNRYLLQEHEDRVHCTAHSEVCGVCGKKYKNVKSLRNHVRFVHYANGKNHLCHFCPAKFKWAGTLKQHIQEVHEGIREFSCPTCSREFFRKSQLNRHMRIHGSDASKRITCSLCNKGFWFENNYLRHMKAIHEPQSEEFHCSYCGKGFSQKASMVAHVQLVHLKIYPYSCKICKTGFTRSKLLQLHMAQVHNETDFVVKDRRQGSLKYSRTAADLLYCHYCNQGFYYKAQVVEHIHQEHTFPHRCDKCKQGFVLKKFLDNHLRKAHGVEVEVSTNDESNDAEEALGSLLELKSESTVLPKYVADRIATLENSEGILGESLLTPPDTECYGNLLGMPGTDTYELSTSGTSLLLEVAKVGSTVHYFIQNDNQNDKANEANSNKQVIKDLTSLLLVAEEASSKESLPVTNGQAETELVTEIQSIPSNFEAVNSSTVEDDT